MPARPREIQPTINPLLPNYKSAFPPPPPRLLHVASAWAFPCLAYLRGGNQTPHRPDGAALVLYRTPTCVIARNLCASSGGLSRVLRSYPGWHFGHRRPKSSAEVSGNGGRETSAPITLRQCTGALLRSQWVLFRTWEQYSRRPAGLRPPTCVMGRNLCASSGGLSRVLRSYPGWQFGHRRPK